MKRRVLAIALCLLLVGVFVTTYNMQLVGADSGFDTSYDSGGSDFGGYDFDSGSGGGGGSDPATLLCIPYVFWGVIGLVLCSNNFENKNKSKLKSILILLFYILSMIGIITLQWVLIENEFSAILFLFGENLFLFPWIFVGLSPSKIKQITVEGIDNSKIVNDSFENYKDLQIAWMNFDYDKIKELVSDEMYNMYTNQLSTLKLKNQQNIMSEIEFIEGYITEYKKVNNKQIFKVYLSVSCYDYIINTKNNNVVRGNKNTKLTLSYVLTFERNAEIVKYCPQCGAPVNNLTECEYCKSKIVNNTSKIKMVKKEIKSQK